MSPRRFGMGFTFVVLMSALPAVAEQGPVVGRWDLTVGESPNAHPSWLGVTYKDGKYHAQFVGAGGGVGDVPDFKSDGQTVEFKGHGAHWKGTVSGDTMAGDAGSSEKWVGKRYVAKVDVSGSWAMKFIKDGRQGRELPLKLLQKGDEITGEQGKRRTQAISDGKLKGNVLTFTAGKGAYTATVKGDVLEGEMEGPSTGGGKGSMKFTAQRERAWAKPVELFDGKTLENWKPLDRPNEFHWKVVDGIMSNTKSGANIVTERKFGDFKLHVEFRVPEHSNSGVYLRGRYEVQVQDDYGKPTEAHMCGALYSRLKPSENATKPAGEWQTFDVTLIGNYVTVVLNGKTIIDNKEIEGITGGAIDGDEGSPGPIYIQGDHGPVDYRKVTITPAKPIAVAAEKN